MSVMLTAEFHFDVNLNHASVVLRLTTNQCSLLRSASIDASCILWVIIYRWSMFVYAVNNVNIVGHSNALWILANKQNKKTGQRRHSTLIY